MRSFFDLLPELQEASRHSLEPFRLPVQLGEASAFMFVRALVPGVDKENLSLELHGQTLIISYRLNPRCGVYLRQERPSGVFRRSVDLGRPVRADGIEANLKNGVLTVTVPKKDIAGDGGKKRRIVCNAG